MRILADDLPHRFAERCGGCDRDNHFFHEDFETCDRPAI